MKIYTSLCGAAVAALLLPACATVTRGTSQQFVIESTPNEAQVALSTGQNCVTPCKLKLKRKTGFTATVQKPGFQTAHVEVKSKLSGGGAAAGMGNVLIGGVIGAVVDGSSGALNDLSPNPLKVELVAEAMEAPAAEPVASEASTMPTVAPASAEAAPAEAAAPSPGL